MLLLILMSVTAMATTEALKPVYPDTAAQTAAQALEFQPAHESYYVYARDSFTVSYFFVSVYGACETRRKGHHVKLWSCHLAYV